MYNTSSSLVSELYSNVSNQKNRNKTINNNSEIKQNKKLSKIKINGKCITNATLVSIIDSLNKKNTIIPNYC